MSNDFFEYTAEKVKTLNETDLKLFNFVVKNMDRVKHMSIRMFAHECFVSTTTIFRFVKKLGFLGYNQFIAVLQLTDDTAERAEIPQTMKRIGYREEYLKNIIETLRVLKSESINALHEVLLTNPKIYLFSYGMTAEAARYIQHLMLALGYDAELVLSLNHALAAIQRIDSEDLVFVLSYTGESAYLVDILKRIKRKCRAKVVSVTRADNNMTQILSDINFYVFADDLQYCGTNITSRISMIAVIETMLYELFAKKDEILFTKK